MQLDATQSIDALVEAARQKSLRFIEESERRFVDTVTGRGAMTAAQAVAILNEQREVVLDQLDENMAQLRAWLLRGGTDLN